MIKKEFEIKLTVYVIIKWNKEEEKEVGFYTEFPLTYSYERATRFDPEYVDVDFSLNGFEEITEEREEFTDKQWKYIEKVVEAWVENQFNPNGSETQSFICNLILDLEEGN